MLSQISSQSKTSYLVTSIASSEGEVPHPKGSWHNDKLGADVNSDGRVSPLDALFVADMLRASGSTTLPDAAVDNNLFVDVNGDGKVSTADVQLIIDFVYSMYKKPLLPSVTVARILAPLDSNALARSAAPSLSKPIASIGLLAMLASGTKNPFEIKALTNLSTLVAAANLNASVAAAYIKIYPKPQPIILPFIFFH